MKDAEGMMNIVWFIVLQGRHTQRRNNAGVKLYGQQRYKHENVE